MLKFNSNGRFGILLFGDLHESFDYEDSKKFKDMQKMMNAALDMYRPDLCVLLGDNYYTTNCKKDPEGFIKGVKAVCGPILSRKIPVAAIMGNHEHDPGCDEEIIAAYNKIEGMIMRCDGVPGKADFKEVIYSHDGKKPLACLWFLDSNNLGEDASVSFYDWVHEDQIEWFEKESEKLRKENDGNPLPSYVFQHIPIPEEYRLLRKAKLPELPWAVEGFGKRRGTHYVKARGTVGYLGEAPAAPDFNGGEFEAWKRTGAVKAAFFGHDHLNDFSGFVDGIFLAQHKTAGFRAYTDGCHSCVRYLELSERNPARFRQELRHFKEFGLKSESLGYVFKNFTDREAMAFHAAGYSVAALASIGALTYFIKKLTK
ncbi:MAG: metallophosphoesterase [Clostridia bacterium]|nr:metallophosphoesterase [Clostridia bacterium]